MGVCLNIPAIQGWLDSRNIFLWVFLVMKVPGLGAIRSPLVWFMQMCSSLSGHICSLTPPNPLQTQKRWIPNPSLCSHHLLYPPCVGFEHPKHSGNSGGRQNGCITSVWRMQSSAQPSLGFLSSSTQPQPATSPELEGNLSRPAQVMYLQEKALETSYPHSHGSINGCR